MGDNTLKVAIVGGGIAVMMDRKQCGRDVKPSEGMGI